MLVPWLWLLCGLALVSVALIALVGGASTGGRSLDDVYARRGRRGGDAAG